MNVVVRKLEASDWKAMTRLRMARKTHAGAQINEFTSNLINFVHDRYQQAPNLAAGLFEDNTLKAYICAYGQPKYWVLDLMISSGDPTQLHHCLDFCLAHYEAQGAPCFYYAFPQKWARAYKSFWRESIPRLQKYTIEDIMIIEKNKIPKDEWVWNNVLHEQIVPVSFLLRKSYVK